jgi:RNA polymerase sigma-70 factor (ECF subfamily)
MGFTKIDQLLLTRCFHKEPTAWRDFVDRFLGLFLHAIYHTAQSRSVVLNKDDVDDICSEIYFAILQNDYAILRKFRGESSLATYLVVIARRIAVKEVSARRKAEEMGHHSSYGSGVHRDHSSDRYHTNDKSQSVTKDIERIDNLDQLEKLISGLSLRDADVVKKFHLEGKTYQEISKETGLAENTIGPTLSRARDALKLMVKS